MTTQMSYSERKMGTKYFLGELKRSWPKMVLYFIIFCLTMIIPLLMNDMGMSAYNYDLSEEENILRNSTRLLNTITEYVQVWVPVSMLTALFAGCYVTKILNNKISADFFHSIPMRRESIFLTRLGTGFVTYFATFLINVIIVTVLCETQTLADGYGWLLMKTIIKNLGISVLAYFMIYSTTVFAGMLCGTTVMQLLMTLYLNIILFIYYASFFLTFEQFFDYFNSTYYLEDASIVNLVPFVRLMSLDLIEQLKIPDICFFAIGSLLLLMGALALYRFRRIEKAGTPVVFDGFAAFFRYSVIIPVTLLGGLFFDLLVGSSVWYIIGLFIGAFLCFLLLNAILAKNARKMFSGIKAFGIYCAAMIVFFLVLGFDIFKVDNYVPNAANIDSVNITVGNQIQKLEFKELDVINAVINLDRSHKNQRKEISTDKKISTMYKTVDAEVVLTIPTYREEAEQYFYTGEYSTMSFRVVYNLKSGLPWARRVSVYYYSDEMSDLAKAIAESDSYENYWIESLDTGDENYYRDYYPEFDVISEDNDSGNGIVSDKIAVDIKKNFKGIDYNYFQRPQIGKFNFYGSYMNNYRSFHMPVYIGDFVDDIFLGHRSEDDYYTYLASKLISIYVYKGYTDSFDAVDAVRLPYDLDLYKEVLMNLTNICGDRNVFTESEPGYYVAFTYKTEYNSKETAIHNYTTRFLKGSVPASVEVLLP